MKFETYLTENNISQVRAARELCVSQPMINHLIKGVKMPGARLLDRIITWSSGHVQVADFVNTNEGEDNGEDVKAVR